MDSIKGVRGMTLDSLQKLSIEKKGTGICLSLDRKELKHVKEYKIESSSNGSAELTLKLLVTYP